jgi:hypothetical protein
MSSRTSLCTAMLLAGCSSGAPGSPEPCVVEANVSNPYEIELSGPLRYTTVWTTGGLRPGYHVLGGGPVDAKHGKFSVELRMPSAKLCQRLEPKNDLYLSTASAAIAVYRVVEAHRPRVVLYEDVNDDGRLDLEQNGTTEPDRVLAVDDDYTTMGALLDVEELLRESAPPLVDLYYRATGGRFTAFVPTMGTGDYLYLGDASFTYGFSLDDSGLALASLQCSRNVSTASRDTSARVLLDDALDPALCGLEYGNCRSESLEKLAPPAVSAVRSSGTQRQATCRRREGLEALAVIETRLECERCTCTSEAELDVFIAGHKALPSWWPCGDAVDYCESDSSLAEFPIGCVSAAEGMTAGTSGVSIEAPPRR